MTGYVIASVWEPLTAAGTLALATATVGLAISTRRLATQAGAETRANWQPVVVLESAGAMTDYQPAAVYRDGVLGIGLGNVGRGPALGLEVLLTAVPDRDLPLPASISSDVIAPGGRELASWSDFEPPIHLDDGMGRSGVEPVTGEVVYGDASYGAPGYVRYMTEFTLAFSADGAVIEIVDQRFVGPTTVLLTRLDRWVKSPYWQLRWWWRAKRGVTPPWK